MWWREPEEEILPTLEELGIGFATSATPSRASRRSAEGEPGAVDALASPGDPSSQRLR